MHLLMSSGRYSDAATALKQTNMKIEEYSESLARQTFDAFDALSDNDSKYLCAARYFDLAAEGTDLEVVTFLSDCLIVRLRAKDAVSLVLDMKMQALMRRHGKAVPKLYSELFRSMSALREDREEAKSLLKAYINALRSMGDTRSAIAASSAYMTMEPKDYESQLELLSLHVTEVSKHENLKVFLARDNFGVEAFSAVNTFPDADHRVHQYNFHSLMLLQKYDYIIHDYKTLISELPEFAEHLLPWYLNALFYSEGKDELEAFTATMAPMDILATSTGSPRTIIEMTELARHYFITQDATPFFASVKAIINHISSTELAASTAESWFAFAMFFNDIDFRIELLEAIYQIYPYHGLIVSPLARDLYHHGYSNTESTLKAIQLYSSLSSITNLAPMDTFHHACCYENVGHYEEALALYLEWDDVPSSPSRLRRAILLLKMGRFDEGLELYEDLMEIRRKYVPSEAL